MQGPSWTLVDVAQTFDFRRTPAVADQLLVTVTRQVPSRHLARLGGTLCNKSACQFRKKAWLGLRSIAVRQGSVKRGCSHDDHLHFWVIFVLNLAIGTLPVAQQ